MIVHRITEAGEQVFLCQELGERSIIRSKVPCTSTGHDTTQCNLHRSALVRHYCRPAMTGVLRYTV